MLFRSTVAEGDDDRVYMPYFKDIQALGLPMVSVRRILGPFDNWKNYAIPRDGHPNQRLTDAVAKELLKILGP